MADTPHDPTRPVCKCHGEPMRRKSGGEWRCSVHARAADARYNQKNPLRHRARYERRIAAGLCGICGKDVLISESRCFTCLGKLDELNLNRVV